MNTKELITLLEYLLYCLRAYNISGREREEAIKDARRAIKALREGLCQK
jgi:hypothetical protein